MFNRFAGGARSAVERAQDEARALGSPTVEAEHLLLAIAACPDLAPAFAEAGAEHDALVAALELEAASALQAVGVRADDYGSPPARRIGGHPAMGTSAKLALQRALRLAAVRGDKQLQPGHLGLAVLRAPVGTVPRALGVAGIDAAGLRDRLAATL